MKKILILMIVLLTLLISCYWQSDHNMPFIDITYHISQELNGKYRVSLYSLYESASSPNDVDFYYVRLQYSVNSLDDFSDYTSSFLVNHDDIVRVRLSAYDKNGDEHFSSYEIINITLGYHSTTNKITDYKIGGKGPAGGYIFYDCDADNTLEDPDGIDNLLSTTCGWRYLEAAPNDLRVINGMPTVDSSATLYAYANKYYVFGYYRTSSTGYNLYVNGTRNYNVNCTRTAIGTGESNTEKLVNAMGTSAYSSNLGTGKTSDYAARLCSILEHNGYDDWFLPSLYELNLMYKVLHLNGLGSFFGDFYWSSSEGNYDAYYAWYQYFSHGGHDTSSRNYDFYIRPCRAF